MDVAVIATVALVAIGVLAALAVNRRRTPTIGDGRLPSDGAFAPDRAGSSSHVSFQFGRTTSDGHLAPGTTLPMSIETRRVMKDGQKPEQSITIGGQTYHSFDDIQDPALRAQVKDALTLVESKVTDPAMRAALVEELADLGGSAATDAEPPATG